MELRNLREIHAERPHGIQRRVDDDFLLGSKRRLHVSLGILRVNPDAIYEGAAQIVPGSGHAGVTCWISPSKEV